MVRKIFFNGLSEGLTLVVGGLLSIILARALGPAQWGKYNQLSWFIGIAATLGGLGLNFTAIRYLGTNSETPQSPETRSLVIWITLAQLFFASVGGLCVFWFAPRFLTLAGWQVDTMLLRLAGLGLFSLALTQLGLAMLRGLQAFSILFVAALLNSFLLIVTALVTLRFPSIATLLLGTILGQLMLLPWILLQLMRRIGLKPSQIILHQWSLPSQWRALLKYSGFVYLTTLADQIVWQRSEMFFLARLDDPRQSAFYGVAYTISLLVLGTIPTAITGTLTPFFSSLSNNSDPLSLSQSYKKIVSALNLIVLPLAIGLAITAPNLINLLYGQDYASVVSVMRWLILSTTIGIYARPSASILHALNKPQILLIGNSIAIPIDLVLAWLLVPQHGAIGAAQANLMAQLIGATIAISCASLTAKLHYDLQNISKCVLSALGCGIIAWLVINHSNTNSILALALAVILGGLGYVVLLVALRESHILSILARVRPILRRR